MAKGNRPGGGGGNTSGGGDSWKNHTRDLNKISPETYEKVYYSAVDDFNKAQEKVKELKNQMDKMPTRKKADKAAYEEARKKYDALLRNQYGMLQTVSTIENVGVSRGIIKKKTTRKASTRGWGYDEVTTTTWTRTGKKL